MTPTAYQPSKSLPAKLARKMTPYLSRRVISFELDRPVISFTFDDCPETVFSEAVPRLEDEGWRSSIYVACGLFGVTNHHGKMADPEAIKAAHKRGHEIGEHSYSHIDASGVSLDDFISDMENNQSGLIDLGIGSSRTFAYPFGQATPAVKSALENRFEGLRGITPGVHWTRADLNQIKSYPLYENTVDVVAGAIESLKQQPGWLTLFTHDVRTNPSSWGCTPDNMKKIIACARDSGALVLPVDQAIDYLKGHTS